MDIDDYQALWDKAVKEGKFQTQPREPSPSGALTASPDENYWKAVQRLSRGLGDAPDVLSEVRKTIPSNPVTGPTLGSDQEPNVTPDWTSGDGLAKLDELKRELHELGDKLAALGGGSDGVKIQGKEPGGDILASIRRLREKIDDLSDTLAPGREKDIKS